ncbi:MAG TPA: hypothetical protein VFQ18_03805 [Candidatus Acidoferrum sp.]|jgi:hypothetical protein|nr:hypothetical protein [Candidatus Acidoferrum sp.]
MATKKNKKKLQAKRKKAHRQKAAPKRKASSKKAAPRKKPAPKKARVRGKSQGVDTVVFESKGLGARSGGQSGDLQGLSNREGAASESVDELLEEGNAFEAEVVKGVEDASNANEREVVTHEVPEDDVPEEYRDKDL